MRLYLVRHPKPSSTGALCYGRIDVAVDSTAFAAALAEVRRRIPAAILRAAPIYTSPLSRCAHFASALAQPRAAIVADELVEIDFGRWEGKPWDDIPRDELDAWAEDLWGYRAGGGESAEMLATRWQRWRDRVSPSHPDAVIAVTHAGVIRVALARAGRLAMSDLARSSIGFGSVHCIDHADATLGSRSETRVGA